ncbi:MAG: hypothetical protein IT282_16735 [Bacteroidetes bacterium]|nr:hypothetical protein [Bacteroidota bacterium]
MAELWVLRESDRRRFRLEDCLTSEAITSLRSAICNFIVGGCVRRLQEQHAQRAPRKYSFLIHTESQKSAHRWQEQVVTRLIENLTEAARTRDAVLSQLIDEAYNDLSHSMRVLNHYIPPIEDVSREVFSALEQGCLMITKVNSERQVEELLDNEGQLRLRTPLNIFIGGQILDRGVTISNLIGFFYGRRPRVYQQDTVLQHSRMFGFRPIEDLAVTRFYTEPQIYDAMRRMHESDVALRDAIERNPEQPVVFIQRDDSGRVIPCSPNKILVSNTTTLRPFKRILPVGFQTDYATRVRPIVDSIDQTIARLHPSADFQVPFQVPLEVGIDMLNSIEQTLVMAHDEGYDFDWDAARAVLNHLTNSVTGQGNQRNIWLLVRRDRNLSRRVATGSHAVFSDAPDTTRTEGVVAQQFATDRPMLMLIRQNGLEDRGWRGTPFYWPVIVAQQNTRTAIFAHETTP